MGIQLTKGSRFNLSKEAPDLKKIAVGLGWHVSQSGQSYDIDASVFMLGTNGRVPDEKYFVFYNNLKSLDGALSHSGDNKTGEGEGDDETIDIDLVKVNKTIQEMIFVVTIDRGQEKRQNFSQIQNAFIRLYNQETKSELARYELKEAFSEETALEFGRLYKKDGEWRFQAVGQGYKAGLQSFVDKYCGATNQEEKTQVHQVESPHPSGKSQKAIALEKKLEQQAPHIFDLAKKADISLKKANLTNHQAKVALCLDISVSMRSLYSSGKIQQLAEKILALGCRFDDDGSIDIFLFGVKAHKGGEMTVDNFKSFVPNLLKQYPLEGGTYYGKVMKMIREFYFPSLKGDRQEAIIAEQPVYVMFVTDGATGDASYTEQQMKWASFEPIFWQFMAIGKSRKDTKTRGVFGGLAQASASDFTFLERLDEMRDRYVDNADFFSVEDPATIDDQELYSLLTTEYPNWVKLARTKNLLR